MSEKLQIAAFGGYGTASKLYLRGRVLHDKNIAPDTDHDSALKNLIAAYKRLESDEVAGARVFAEFQEKVYETITDDEGYFDFVIAPDRMIDTTQVWQNVRMEVASDDEDAPALAVATARVLTPPPSCDYGVISDIDDTIVRSYATALLKAALVLLLQNALSRTPFPGVAAFYQALQKGTGQNGPNPIFYVSSSPWSLHDFLAEFMQIHGIPAGPIFLRDYGLNTLKEPGHRTHKLAVIRPLMQSYPSMRFMSDRRQRPARSGNLRPGDRGVSRARAGRLSPRRNRR